MSDNIIKCGIPILRRDELLNFATIMQLLKATPETEHIQLVDNLKKQASDNGVSKRDIQTLVTQVKTEIKKQSAPVARLHNLSSLPAQLQTDDFNSCGYDISDEGIYMFIANNPIQVCPHPIFVVEIWRDIETNSEKIRLAFKRKGVWRDDIILDRSDISSARSLIKLANYGILVNDENARYLIKFLCDIESNNENIIKTVKSTACLGHSKYGFIPYSTDVVYDLSNSDNKRRFALYKEHGDFATWKTAQKLVCQHTIPRILIAAGYASLMLESFGLNPFGVHLWGDTGKGKSVAIVASASIYGYPAIDNGIVYTGNATSNGLEPRLSFVRNCCFYLDELSMLSAKQIDDMIMLIMQGQGKARMSRTGNARETYYWNCVSVSNSEMPITNDFSKGGVYNRIIQISAKGKVFGDMNLPEIAETFKNNYGFGAKIFLDFIDTDEIKQLLPELRKQYYNQLIQHTEDKQANAASVLLCAFNIARKYIYNNDTPELTADDIIPFLHSCNEISQVMRTYEKFISYVQANYKMFDSSEIGMSQQKWGQLAKHKEFDCVDIFPHRLDEFIHNVTKDSIPISQFIGGLDDRNLLIRGKNDRTFTVRISDKIQRVYSIKFVTENPLQKPVTNTNDTKNMLSTLTGIENGDLPF